jgi:hypothetical protein
MASLAVSGGYLVYGVKEDKDKHQFTADEMQLPVGLHETVDAIAWSRVTPPLGVVPTLVPNPQDPTAGFLVVEIPASPDSPHMVDGSYWGRSETGKVKLTDSEVSRLIVGRGKQADRILQAMLDTAECDPIDLPWQGSHFYFTAVPATGWPDMFANFTQNHASRMRLSQFCTALQNKIENPPVQRPGPIAFSSLISDWRSQRVQGGWLATWANSPSEGRGRRSLGLDDDGAVRYMNLGPYSPAMANERIRYVHEINVLFETWDMVRLVAALSEEANYRGSWLMGVELSHLGGHISQLNDLNWGYQFSSEAKWEVADYRDATSVAAIEVQERSAAVARRLLRGLLRGLGSESFLDQPPFA